VQLKAVLFPSGYFQVRQLGVYILAASLEPNRVPGATLPTLGASLISERQNDELRAWLETNSNQSPHWSEDDAYADLPKVRFPKGKVLVHV
jgi:hypothetical protein